MRAKPSRSSTACGAATASTAGCSTAGLPRYSKDGVFVGFIGTCIDIDERKRAEHELARSLERERKLRIATEEASRLKDGFLASVLSDLQSPVQAIATWAAHLRRQVPAASEPARALDAIEHNARAQDRIISSLLDLSGVARGGAAPAAAGRAASRCSAGCACSSWTTIRRRARRMARVLGIAGAETKAACEQRRGAGGAGRLPPGRAAVGRAACTAATATSSSARCARCPPSAAAACAPRRSPTRDQAEDGMRAVAAGYDAQLAKPVEPVALLATVARLAQPAGV